MGERQRLILKSINEKILTNQLVDSWFETNEMFITKKNFSPDRYSVEITFIDDERAEMMLDLLSTCYSDRISISHPQNLIAPSNGSFEEEDDEEEREPSPVHLSSAMSTSSRISCFSQRLVELDKKKNSNKMIHSEMGRGRGMESTLSQIDKPFIKERDDDSIENRTTVSHMDNSDLSSVFGRGRGAVFK